MRKESEKRHFPPVRNNRSFRRMLRDEAMRPKNQTTGAARPPGPGRGYYMELKRNARSFCVGLDRKKWCDFWHTHFDWDGFGNLGWLDRRRHLNALLTALTCARKELSSQQTPFQLFATIHPKSSTDDAIYVHTANPNGHEFPHGFADALPASSLPPLLKGMAGQMHYVVLKAGHDNPYFIILVKDAVS